MLFLILLLHFLHTLFLIFSFFFLHPPTLSNPINPSSANLFNSHKTFSSLLRKPKSPISQPSFHPSFAILYQNKKKEKTKKIFSVFARESSYNSELFFFPIEGKKGEGGVGKEEEKGKEKGKYLSSHHDNE